MNIKKSAVIKSAISLLLCIAMLTGTTFAWFTDSVTSKGNIIQSGTLDLEMYWTDDLTGGTWHNVEDDAHNTIFTYDNWEPGYTDVKYIKIVNNGNLAFNYKLALTPQGAVGKLAEVINVYCANDKEGIEVTDFADLSGLRSIGLLNTVMNGGATANGTLLAADQHSPIHDSGETIITIAMNMITSAGNDYQGETSGNFTVTALATQAPFETDSFGSDYDSTAEYSVVLTGDKATAAVAPVDGKVPTGGVAMNGSNVSAFVPAGVAVADHADKLTLSVTPLQDTTSGITVVNDEILIPVDVHIDGVAENNDIPIIIELGQILPKYMNMGNYHLFHVEDGVNNEMTLVADKAALTAHNQYTYDPLTGAVCVAMASFSEVALVADTSNAWEGGYDDTWYVGKSSPYTIANADQLYAFAKIVGGMANGLDADDFTGDTVQLLSDINLNGGKAIVDGKTKIFYPIGYYNNTNKYYDRVPEVVGMDGVTSSVSSFSGTFDGNGHTITDFYQNTWEMFGDYNSGYTGTPNYYKDAMGLFGYVLNGTVKNLTVDNFSSDGEFTPTGCVAAYAVNSTFENIAITHCTPRVYNTGNGGIIGIAGDSDDQGTTITLKNITVDNTNKITALWGSYDVACGGLVGMFRGNADGGTGKISFDNCHVSAQMDVYNDVCGNYQYYWYRYCGMIIGSIRHNTTKDGYTVPNTTGISATGCTVHFGTWNDYYYCEFEKNGHPSYSGPDDYKFSRVDKSEIIFDQDGNATGCTHEHTEKENNRAIHLPFDQLFTGYGWGVKSQGIKELEGITILDIQLGEQEKSVEKFQTKFTGDFLYRVGNGNTFPVGALFEAKAGADIVNSGVWVSLNKVDENANLSGEFLPNTSDWTKGTIKLSGTGLVKITIQDYNFCTPTELIVEVVDATNVTSYSELKNANSVLLNDITMTSNGKYSLYDNKTLYGNGFTFNVINGMDSDTEGGYIGGNGTVWVRNSTLDNVKIVGEVYTKYGGTATSEYNFPTVLVLGDSIIANSYISNGCAPVRVGSGCNIEIINSTLEGGIFANLDIRGGTVKLQDVTTINQSTASGESISNDKKIVGLGIVIYTGSTVTIDADNLKQYNYISENATFTGEAKTLRDVIFGRNYTEYQFESENVTWVNTGIVSMVAEVGADNISTIDGYFGKGASIVGFNGYVYAPKPTDPPSVALPAGYSSSTQYQVAPEYSFDYTSKNNVPQVSGSNDYCYYDASTQKYLVSFDDGEKFTWDADILTITKGEETIVPSISVSGGATVNSDNTITFDTEGNYTVTYKYTDDDNYRFNSEGKVEKYSVAYEKTVKITVYVVQDTSAKTEFAFGSNGFRTETANNLTYVMPNVNATVDSNTAGIGVTTVGGVNIYYPIVSMHKSGTSSWYNYFSVFEAVTITDLNGTAYSTSTTGLPSGLTVIGGFILDANGKISTAESANGTGIFNYSTGKEIKCATYSSYGLCYYPDSKFSSSTNSRDEQTIVVKYRYTDSNGTPYYYYVGYWCEKHTKQNTCVTGDTLVTLANGTQKRIDQVTYEDQLLVWDFDKGAYTVAGSAIIENHGYNNNTVIELNFEDGTTVKTVNMHGFFDADLNKWVDIHDKNANNFIGHNFIQVDGNSYKTVKLISVEVYTEYVEAWSILTADHYNCIMGGLFSITPPATEQLAFFDIGENMKYDAEAKQADIQKYGLFTYEEFKHLATEEQFEAFNIAEIKIAIGKGLISYEEILELLAVYA